MPPAEKQALPPSYVGLRKPTPKRVNGSFKFFITGQRSVLLE